MAGLDVPAPSSVWYGCMITAPRSAQYAFSAPIMSWKFTRRRLRIALDALGARGHGAQAEAAVVLVRRRDHAQRLARGPLRDLGVGERRSEQALDPVDPLGRERQRVGTRSARRRRRRPAASSRRAAPPPRTRRSSSDAAGSRRARAASAGTRARADRAAARAARTSASSSTSRKRVSASNAFALRSCSVKSRSIASSPTRPTESR